MSREVRMVPANWEHPKDESGVGTSFRFSVVASRSEPPSGTRKPDSGPTVSFGTTQRTAGSPKDRNIPARSRSGTVRDRKSVTT